MEATPGMKKSLIEMLRRVDFRIKETENQISMAHRLHKDFMKQRQEVVKLLQEVDPSIISQIN